MGERAVDRRTNIQRWAAALLLVLLVPLGISFNARLSAIQQMRQDEARLKQEVAAEQARQAELATLRAYVSSDAYVEHWARVEARMARPGEVAVVPVAPASAASDSPAPPQAHVPASILDEWWTLFFESAP